MLCSDRLYNILIFIWAQFTLWFTTCMWCSTSKRVTLHGNLEVNIYSIRAFSKLQNGTLFIEINQNNKVWNTPGEILLKILIVFCIFCCFHLFLENISATKSPFLVCYITYPLHKHVELWFTSSSVPESVSSLIHLWVRKCLKWLWWWERT